MQSNPQKIREYENLLQEQEEFAKELKQFAEIWQATYQPIFQFRESLFDNLKIYDQFNLLLDESEEAIVDPIHLLRYYEFDSDGQRVELKKRVETPYELTFRFRYYGTSENFKQKQLNKLTAFEKCQIQRRLGGAIAPTPLLEELKKQLLPGVIIMTEINQRIIIQLKKQGLTAYSIFVSFNDLSKPKQYTFFPGLSGVLAIAASGVKLRLPDDEDFYIV